MSTNLRGTMGKGEPDHATLSNKQSRNNSMFCIPKLQMKKSNFGNNPNSSTRKQELKQMNPMNLSSMQKKSFLTELTVPAKQVKNNQLSYSQPVHRTPQKKNPDDIPLFDDDTQDNNDDFLPNLPSLQMKPSTVRSRSKQIISINEFDPNSPRTINEELSLQAMDILGIQMSELCYPTNEELLPYSHDDTLLSVATQRLNRRAESAIQAVKDERDSIIRLRDYQESQIEVDSMKAREALTTLSIAAAKGAQKIAKDAAEEKLLQAIADLKDQKQKELDYQKFLQKEEERRKELEEKHRYEAERNKLLQQRAETRQKERNEFVNNYFQNQERKEQYLADKRAEDEENHRQRAIETNLDIERKLANAEKIHTQKVENLKKKLQEEEQKAAETAEFLVYTQDMKQRELAEKNAAEEQEKKRRIEIIKKNMEEITEKKRQATIQNMQKKEELFNQRREEKIQYLQQQKEINEKKSEEHKKERERKAYEKQKIKEKNLEMAESKAVITLQQVAEEKNKTISINSALEKLKAEDVKLAAERQEKRRLSQLRELEEINRKREIRASKLAKEKQKLREQGDRERMQTSFQFSDMLNQGNKNEFRGKSEEELRQMARDLGLDYDAIAAKLERRGRQK